MTDLSKLYDAPSSVAARASEAAAQVAPHTSAAATIYDATPAASAPAAAPQDTLPTAQAPRTQEDHMRAFYGQPEELPAVEIPENIKALREADGLRQMFSAQGTFAEVLPDDLWAGDETAKDIPVPVQRAAIAELREMAADVAMSNDDVRALQVISQHLSNPPSSETRAAWRQEALSRVNQEFGASAEQVLRDARTLVSQDPRRAQFLNAKGLGDHPDTVLMLARLAHKARLQGKLK